MKTQVILCALILSIAMLKAQSSDKKTTVRIKKVEKINGIEKISDTTYTIDGPFKVHSNDAPSERKKNGKTDESEKSMIIITDELNDGSAELKTLNGKNMDELIKQAMKEAGEESESIQTDKIIMVDVDEKLANTSSEKAQKKIIILKKIMVTEPSQEEIHLLNKNTGINDNKLVLDKLDLYPNPNSGKFNLHFSLSSKGTAELTIYNLEGKSVYAEKLSAFSGIYHKEIDISANPKGIYFVKITQNEHSQVKKIVLD